MIIYDPTLKVKDAVGKYGFKYSEIKRDYDYFKGLSDKEFKKKIVSALHFTVFVCYVKEISSDDCLSDEGIVHQMVHLIQGIGSLKKVRKQFNSELKIS